MTKENLHILRTRLFQNRQI